MDSRIKYFTFLIYCILIIGALSNNSILQVIGCMTCLIYLSITTIQRGLCCVMAMIPNTAIFSVSGISVLGVAFAILLIKLLIRQNWRLGIGTYYLISFLYLLILGVSRFFDGNIHDFIMILQLFIVIFTWLCVLKNLNVKLIGKYINFFCYGCLLMSLGMIVQYFLQNDTIGRFCAILDDSNYTGAVMCVLFGICLLSYCFNLSLKNNKRYLCLAIIMGLATGSRGYILSISVILAILYLTHSFGANSRKFVLLCLVFLASLVVLYILNFGPIVTVYNNTIGRTITLQDSHSSGQFMDVTSGRTLLWLFYAVYAIEHVDVFLWGRGFFNYHLEENGGFGLAAHNMYISSIIGIGVIGTFLILVLYVKLLKSAYKNHNCNIKIAFSSIFISICINYFFLDGIFDLRLISYIAISIMLMCLYKSKLKQSCRE